MNRRTAHHVRAGVVIARADYAYLQTWRTKAIRDSIERDLFRTGGPRNRTAQLAYVVALDRFIRKARPAEVRAA